jgi:acyl-coenzyme A synthetase/AMP-(fatty) acid ligase
VALQKLGAIPITALPQHRYRELEQFARLSEAVACVVPGRAKDVDFRQIVDRVRASAPTLRLAVIDGVASEGFLSLADLLDREPTATTADLDTIAIDPDDPAVFQLSGGTTGIPKLIPAPTTTTPSTPAWRCRCATSGTATPCSTCCRSPTTSPWRARGCKGSGSRAPGWWCTRPPAARRCSR